MDGVEYAPFEERLESGRMLVDIFASAASSGSVRLDAPGAVDPRIAAAAVTCLIYGWVATQDWLVEIYGLQDEDLTDVESRLRETAVYLAELAFPPAEEPQSE